MEEKEIDRIRKSAKRLAQWGKVYDNEDLARKAKTMQARAEKLDAQKTFVSKGSGLELSLDSAAMRSKTVFTLENLSVEALDDGRPLVECELLVAQPGDRIALLGNNGTGKSTTIKKMLGQEDGQSIRFNPNVRTGYVDQELEAFNVDQGRYDWLAQRLDVSEGQIKKVLLQAGIAYADFGQRVSTLSGGEKARMMFMALRLQQPNFMVLDEPTNHIDLESREQLEEQLCTSGATVLITSHDRRFLEAVCTRFWMIHQGALTEVESLDTYYDQVVGWTRPGAEHAVQTETQTQTDEPGDPDAILARIVELEALIEDDVARKPKFQKPQKQAAWQQELDQLWMLVNQAD